MIRSDRRRRACGLALLLLTGLAAPRPLAAEESFRATHLAFFHPPNTQAERPNRLGIFRLDPERRALDYRITIVLPAIDQVTGFRLARRDADGERVLRDVPLQQGGVTFTGSLAELSADELGAIDSGLAYVVVTSRQNTSAFVEARLDPIPNGVAGTISPAAAVPPAADSKGFGSGLVVLDQERRRARWYLHWERMTGRATGLQIQNGTVIDAGVLLESFELAPAYAGDAVGIWTELSDEEMLALRSGRIYLNITSDAYPAGEIRGEVNPIEVFTTALEPAHEAPPAAGTSASGTGYLFVIVDGNNGTLGNAAVAAGAARQELTGASVRYGGIGQNGGLFTGLVDGGSGGYFIPQQVMQDPTDLAILRSGGMYVNIAGEGYPDGEIRGQLVPSALHVTPASGVPAGAPATTPASIVYDRASDAIRFSIDIPSADPSLAGDLVVCDMTGRRVLVGRTGAQRGAVPARGLAAGVYLTRIVLEGRVVAARTIAIAR